MILQKIKRRLLEFLYLKLDLGAPPGKQEGGICIEPYCRWPYHIHELFRVEEKPNKPDPKMKDVIHRFTNKGSEDHWRCSICGANDYDHCSTDEHPVSRCPGDHGK